MFGKKIKTGYESDATRMIRELLEIRPEIADEQKKGRSLWWDRRLDLDLLRREQESRVAQKGYVYQTDD
jgi:7,8-dihydro-6-hydroxymethylpterin-pyrophosphokinase